jgi:hypothetical protein
MKKGEPVNLLKIFFIILVFPLISCKSETEQYEQYVELRENWSNYSVNNLIKGFDKLKKIDPASQLKDMLQALQDGNYEKANDLYFLSDESGMPFDKTWINWIFRSLEDKKGNAYYAALNNCYRPLLVSQYAGNQYAARPGMVFGNGYTLLGYSSVDELLSACGAAPKGKVIICTKQENINNINEKIERCNYETMALLPDSLFPTNLDEAEYALVIDRHYDYFGTYNNNTLAYREDVVITLTHLVEKTIIHRETIRGKDPPDRAVKSDSNTSGEIDENEINEAYLKCLKAAEGAEL